MINESMNYIIKQKKLFIFDLDGTLYLDGVLFPKVLELLAYIKNNDGKYIFLTNNSSKSSKDYVKKIKNLGIPCDIDNIATSTQATIQYVKSLYPKKLFYVLGTKSMTKEIEEAGILITTKYEKNIDGVIIGYDTELVYEKLEIASKLITEGKIYIATHPDLVCPVEFGFVPDCGAFIKMLEYATKRTPIIIGKPERLILDMILEKTNYQSKDAILIGDRLYTDIACGQNAGIDTCLVLSGETEIEDVDMVVKKPTFILKDVEELYNILNKGVAI